MLSHPKGGGAPPGTRATVGGIPFKEDPNAPRPCNRRTREGGAARESKNDPEKKGRSAPGGIAEENAETRLGTAWERICPPLVEDMLMPRTLRLENERRQLHLIVPSTVKKELITRTGI